ncbi:uncharacterized protein LOC130378667 [Gadus chalcogrammus]|uniref:uncharacterized protein LOC130378667 n=1 Tax=Gadus chalcogrammus TaxID=1042646 RepID=UPI0024C2E646|nr:uncharacterized protein LOC130378667 [Gadus chalcogrammus]
MAAASKKSHKWTPEQTRHLIRFQTENDHKFVRSKFLAKQLWETLVKEMGLVGMISGQQAAKKWENLKQRYRELRTPKTGSGTDRGEVTAANWQFFEDMHEVMGDRPAMDPPVVVASFSEDPTQLLMEMVEPPLAPSLSAASTSAPSTSAPSLSAASTSAASPSAASPPAATGSPSPSPRKNKIKNPVLEFLVEESAKEERRNEEEKRRHTESQEKTDRLLSLFEKMVDKM